MHFYQRTLEHDDNAKLNNGNSTQTATYNHKILEQMLIFQLKVLYNNILSHSRQPSHLKPTGIFNHWGLFFIYYISYMLLAERKSVERMNNKIKINSY